MTTTRRVALYSHDAVGLGHIRRNLAIATALVDDGLARDVLLLSGTPEATSFARPAGVDIVTLPAFTKNGHGAYAARHLSLPPHELARLRGALIQSALHCFAADLLVVDKHPRGICGELEPALADLATQQHAHVVLGLRDVLDAPGRARMEWDAAGGTDAVDRWYDEVWVYGDRDVHDLLATGELPGPLADRTTFTGYLARGRTVPDVTHPACDGRPYALVLVGGGRDGRALAEAAVLAPSAALRSVVVTGPQMPAGDRDHVRRLAWGRHDVVVLESLPDAGAALHGAAAVVSMGGYNSVCELLASDVPALIVPRAEPRAEQLIRARALADRGLLDVLPPDDLSPLRLRAWLDDAPTRPRRPRAGIDLDGLARLPALARRVVEAPDVPATGAAVVAHHAVA